MQIWKNNVFKETRSLKEIDTKKSTTSNELSKRKKRLRSLHAIQPGLNERRINYQIRHIEYGAKYEELKTIGRTLQKKKDVIENTRQLLEESQTEAYIISRVIKKLQ